MSLAVWHWVQVNGQKIISTTCQGNNVVKCFKCLIKAITSYTFFFLNHVIHKCSSLQNQHVGHRARIIILVDGMILFIPLSVTGR